MKNTHKQKGFSLIELIVVISIMTITAGILIPTYTSMRPKLRLSGAARQMQGDLMWAKMQAVRQNNNFVVFFDTETCVIESHQGYGSNDHSYLILDDDDSDGVGDSGETTIIKHLHTNYNDVTFNPSYPTGNPVFNSRGTLDGASSITIYLYSSSTEETKEITISIAGSIKVN